MRIRDAICLRDTFFMLFCLVPICCLFIILVLALMSLAVSGLDSATANHCKRRGFVAVTFGLAVLLSLLILLVCLGLSPVGVGLVTVVALTGVLRCIVFLVDVFQIAQRPRACRAGGC